MRIGDDEAAERDEPEQRAHCLAGCEHRAVIVGADQQHRADDGRERADHPAGVLAEAACGQGRGPHQERRDDQLQQEHAHSARLAAPHLTYRLSRGRVMVIAGVVVIAADVTPRHGRAPLLRGPNQTVRSPSAHGAHAASAPSRARS
jgi:hypothetical protein